MSGIRIESKVHFKSGRRSKKQLRTGVQPTPALGRVPRVARLMALAIRFEQLVADGVVADYAELSRLGHVTRARMTQIMKLLLLSPEIQARALTGELSVSERDLRAVVSVPNWRKQLAALAVSSNQ